LGIFIDQAALGLFMPYLGEKEYVKLRELVLAFVNAVSHFNLNKFTDGENDLPSCFNDEDASDVPSA
jgi:hypothetical protein